MLNSRLITMDVLLTCFAEAGAIPRADLESKSRKAEHVLPRHALFLAARCWTDISYPVIGKRVGGRDHSTAMYGASEAATTLWCNLAPIKEILEKRDAYAKYSRDQALYKILIERGAREAQKRVPGFKAADFSLLDYGGKFLQRGFMTVTESAPKEQSPVMVRFSDGGAVLKILNLEAA